jgi:transposase
MNNNYQLFIGIDVSKGKADAAILQVSDLRSISPKFFRKRLSFKFIKSEVTSFLNTVRSYSDDNCTSIHFGLEVTGIYSTNVYSFIKSNLKDNESIKFLNTDFVNQWRQAHNIAKSDPLDAQTISSIIGTDSDVQYVNDSVFEIKNGYQDLKALVHRHYQIKKIYSQEMNRLIAQCDCVFPELQYVFEPKSAAFIAILSSYPTTYDITRASQFEVFHIVYEATKHHCTTDKIDTLFELCQDTLVPDNITNYSRDIISNLVENIKNIKGQLKIIEKDIKDIASLFEIYKLLITMTGCGPLTAATVIAETGNINRFKNADRYVSYSGTSPRNKRSGTSVETTGKISKKGSRYLRHAIYMIAEFARRHNPVLKAQFERIKNGNRKRHKLATVAIANKIARYIYSILKYKSSFVILHEHIMRLPEETRNTFFNSISLDFPKNTRKQIYRYSDHNGEVHPFVYIKSDDLLPV